MRCYSTLWNVIFISSNQELYLTCIQGRRGENPQTEKNIIVIINKIWLQGADLSAYGRYRIYVIYATISIAPRMASEYLPKQSRCISYSFSLYNARSLRLFSASFFTTSYTLFITLAFFSRSFAFWIYWKYYSIAGNIPNGILCCAVKMKGILWLHIMCFVGYTVMLLHTALSIYSWNESVCIAHTIYWFWKPIFIRNIPFFFGSCSIGREKRKIFYWIQVYFSKTATTTTTTADRERKKTFTHCIWNGTRRRKCSMLRIPIKFYWFRHRRSRFFLKALHKCRT